MSYELMLIIEIVGLLVCFTTILSFFLARKDRNIKTGTEHGELTNDIKYIKQAQMNILVSQEKISTKLDNMNEKVIRQDEQIKQLDKRVGKIEKQLEKQKGE